jgi:hypothetical protein
MKCLPNQRFIYSHRKVARFAPSKGRTRLRVVSFVEQKAPCKLKLDYYKMLKVQRGASKEAIRRSYTSLVQSPPDFGYTQDTLFSRAILLKVALECLLDTDARKSYDRDFSRDEASASVSLNDLSGALCLLQESGDASSTIQEIGAKFLAENAADPFASDIAVTVALGHCDRAAALLSKGPGHLSACCTSLEAALKLLKTYQAAPYLQQQVNATLEVNNFAAMLTCQH